jgi:hypothetical protein
LRNQAEEAKKQAADIKREISEQAGASLETAKENLKEAAQKVTDYGHNLIEEQKSRLAEIIHEYSQAARATSEKLHQEDHSALADRATELASRFDRVSRYLRERKPSEIYRDAEQFTRRRPEIVFGLMFAAGLLTARFLKASDPGTTRDRTPNAQSELSPSVPPARSSTTELVSENAP